MGDVQQRHGGAGGAIRSADIRADARIRRAALVVSVLCTVLMGWFGWHYVVGNKISGQLIAFQTYDDHVQVHLEVRKRIGTSGYCTVRAQSKDTMEVGRADFRFTDHRSRIDEVVTLRTTARPTNAVLVGCHAD